MSLTDRQREALDAGRQKAIERIRRRHALLRIDIEIAATYCVYITRLAPPGRASAIAALLSARVMRVSARTVRRVLKELRKAA